MCKLMTIVSAAAGSELLRECARGIPYPTPVADRVASSPNSRGFSLAGDFESEDEARGIDLLADTSAGFRVTEICDDARTRLGMALDSCSSATGRCLGTGFTALETLAAVSFVDCPALVPIRA